MGDELPLKLRLKLPPGALQQALESGDAPASSSQALDEAALLLGARGGAAVKELLTTAPNIEEAIRDFQGQHGVAAAHAQLLARRAQALAPREAGARSLAPPVQLLDLLGVRRSRAYAALLDALLREMLLRVRELPPRELQRALEATFPYIEFRELRAVPIAILSRQEDTPEAYLRELTENRRILAELPRHVRRKILQVDRHELQLFVDECTREYVQDQLAWYTEHPTRAGAGQLRRKGSASLLRKRSAGDLNADNLWNVSSHVPTSVGTPSSSSSAVVGGGPSYSPDDRRHNSPALTKLAEMLGDSEELYRATLEVWKEYIVAGSIPGGEGPSNNKEYVDYVPLLGAMRADLANLQRDKTTPLLRTDPLHKFIWFLDRALKSQTLELAQLHELLGFVGKLRVGDLPPNKKFKKTAPNGAEMQEEEENFEVVLGPPPADELLAVLDKISKSDARQIFAEPVPDDVPKYREIITDPMDLSTMRKKAKKGKYKTIEMFTEDFNLMIRNCLTFNPDTTVFYKEGKRIGKRGNELIEKSSVLLRGEPQRIRAKKRRKSGPGEAVAMLTSSGVTSLKDYGDVDQSGMIPEGMCDEMLADVALILSDPYVKHLLCDALMRKLVICWQKKELPTDNLTCRALVQLLQIGNPSSVRRMIRKNDYVLRASQVVTMRVALPLLLRSMMSFRVVSGFPDVPEESLASREDILSPVLWENVLRASSAIRSLTKTFAVQCLVDHQVEVSAKLLQFLLAADVSLLRDRVLLHAVGEVVIEQLKTQIAAISDTKSTSNESSTEAHESGEIIAELRDRVQDISVFKLIVSDFFVETLALRIQEMKETTGIVIEILESPVEGASDQSPKTAERVVESFPYPAFYEKTAMILAAVTEMVEKVDASKVESVMTLYTRRVLNDLRGFSSFEDFKLLWESEMFASCKKYFDIILTKCPSVRSELFRPDEKPVPVTNGANTTEAEAVKKVVEAVTSTEETEVVDAAGTATKDESMEEEPSQTQTNEVEVESQADATSESTSATVEVEEGQPAANGPVDVVMRDVQTEEDQAQEAVVSKEEPAESSEPAQDQLEKQNGELAASAEGHDEVGH